MSETRPGPRAPSPGQHVVMFWILATLAFLVFTPCVLLPIWTRTEVIREHEATVEAITADLRQQADRNAYRIEALQEDPQVNERIARRSFNHRPADEQVVAYEPAELAAFRPVLPEPPSITPAEPMDRMPEWARKAGQWLPAWPWRELFVESPNRFLLMALAGGLLAAAFFLYMPKSEVRSE